MIRQLIFVDIVLATIILTGGCGQLTKAQPVRPVVPIGTSAAISPPAVAATSAFDQLEVTVWRPGASTTPRQPPEFVSLSGLLPHGVVQLSNGVRVRASDWPALTISSTNLGSCTATLIGPRVMVTAAHCVDAGLAPGALGQQTLPGRAVFGDKNFQMECEMHPIYAQSPLHPQGGPRASQDWALCFLDREVNLNGLRFESIATDIPLQSQNSILMTGYGCTNIAVGDNGKLTYARGDGSLRMGDGRIERVNMSLTSQPGVYVRTKSENAEPILCPGDSGGPVVTGATLANQLASRRIRGVNSAVGWAHHPGRTDYDFFSYLSPFGTNEFRSFLIKWVSRHQNPIICGHNRNPGLGGCRL